MRVDQSRKIAYWHRDLPPPGADPAGEYVVEATSRQVNGAFSHRDEIWDECYDDLMVHACARIEQEVARLEGLYAHVLNESIDVRRNDQTSRAWLHGQFRYVLYRRPV